MSILYANSIKIITYVFINIVVIIKIVFLTGVGSSWRNLVTQKTKSKNYKRNDK